MQTQAARALTIRFSSVLFFSLLLFGCDHPLHIVGQGDIDSASGQRNCLLQ